MRSHLDCNPSLSPHARNALVHHMNSNTQRDHVFDPHHLVIDALAGTVTFIVSLPLCLGIAIASDAPIISGVIAGIVAGVVVGALSGAHVVVSGQRLAHLSVFCSPLSLPEQYKLFWVCCREDFLNRLCRRALFAAYFQRLV